VPEVPRKPPANENKNNNLYAQPQARLARRLVLDKGAELATEVRMLLAQGLCSIYDDDNEYIELPDAMERAFCAAINTKAVLSNTEPKLYREAMRHPDSELWHQAMVRKMEAHLENSTWELVKLPHGRQAIGSKWVFKVKCNPDCTVKRYKARSCGATENAQWSCWRDAGGVARPGARRRGQRGVQTYWR
jgi:hypothetical protein